MIGMGKRKEKRDVRVNISLTPRHNRMLGELATSCKKRPSTMAEICISYCWKEPFIISNIQNLFEINPDAIIISKPWNWKPLERRTMRVKPALTLERYAELEQLAKECGPRVATMAEIVLAYALEHSTIVSDLQRQYNFNDKYRVMPYHDPDMGNRVVYLIGG